jgi:hypothetical protein
MDLEHSVSSAVMKAHAMERALHSTRPWFISIGGVKRSAKRITSADRIGFWVDFTADAHFTVMPDSMTLLEGSVVRGVREFRHPGGDFSVCWEFSLDPVGESVGT